MRSDPDTTPTRIRNTTHSIIFTTTKYLKVAYGGFLLGIYCSTHNMVPHTLPDFTQIFLRIFQNSSNKHQND